MPIALPYQWPRTGRAEELQAKNFDWGSEFYFATTAANKYADSDVDLGSCSFEWVVICPADTYVAPFIKKVIKHRAAERPDVDIFYADDVHIGSDGSQSFVDIKPEFDPTLLMSNNYIGPAIVVRVSAFYRLGGIGGGAEKASVFDLLLRAWTGGLLISHIGHVLFAYSASEIGAASGCWKSVLEAKSDVRDYEVINGLTPNSVEIRRRFKVFPAITLIVTADDRTSRPPRDFAARLLNAGWPAEKIFVALARDSLHQNLAEFYRNWPLIWEDRSLAALDGTASNMNTLWRNAPTEHVVFVDWACELQPNWLRALLTFSSDLGVGLAFGELSGAAVGARSPERSAQEPVAPVGGRSALLEKLQHESLNADRTVFATRRACLIRTNGFDPRFSPELSILDFCLRLKMLGSRVVYTPYCCAPAERLTSAAHHEPEEMALFFNRWMPRLSLDAALRTRFGLAAPTGDAAKIQSWFDAFFGSPRPPTE